MLNWADSLGKGKISPFTLLVGVTLSRQHEEVCIEKSAFVFYRFLTRLVDGQF
jgi:hypothetical protein